MTWTSGMRRNGKRLEMIEYSYDPTKGTITALGRLEKIPTIKKVIFNPPATIVLWGDGTKTVVKANEPRKKIVLKPDKIEFEDITAYDPEKGLAMCIAKKALGNKGNYYNEFKRWLEEWQ